MMQFVQVFQKAQDRIGDFLSHQKLTNPLLGLIFFCAATQFGLHFWPSSTLVYGVRIDYLSPTLYFLDLLIVLYLSLQFRSLRFLNIRHSLFSVLPILLTNLLFSQNPLITLAWSLHFLLYLLFVSSLFPRSDLVGCKPNQKPTRSDLAGIIATSLLCAIFFQVLLASLQVLLGHTLQGPLYYLGERALTVGQPGIATAQIFGQTMLRAYGTFSHPNIMAGWLVVSLLIRLRLNKSIPSPQFRSLRDSRRVIGAFATIVAFGVLLTQSRTALLSLFGIIIPFLLLKKIKSRLCYFSILGLLLGSICNMHLFSTGRDLSWTQRLDLQGLSVKVVSQYPIFGTGAQASISTYPQTAANFRLLQPDHDSFTLLLSWFGFFGIFAILWLEFRSLRDSRRAIGTLRSLFPLLPLLLFDHYLLTSPQGLFMLLAYLRLVDVVN